MNEQTERAQRLLDDITTLMDMQETGTGEKLWWCFCFGNMLEYIADKTFGFDYDIDLGVLYEQGCEEKIVNTFVGHGYDAHKVCVNDINGRAFNIHFKPREDNLKGTPTIDVYFWVPVGDKLYHTYDVNKEGKPIPSQYIFKGVKREWLVPPKGVVEKERTIGKPGREQLLTDVGTWKFPIFAPETGLTIRLPYAIGHLLDVWYGPSWRFREYYRGQSRTKWKIKVTSCKELYEKPKKKAVKRKKK